MDASAKLAAYMLLAPLHVQQVVDFDADEDRLMHLNLTSANKQLTAAILADTAQFAAWITNTLEAKGCRYGIGGYFEDRGIYRNRALFQHDDEARSLHLGMDIWSAEGTVVRAPIEGTIHSFADNNNPGDYGPTIILQHNVNGLTLYSLYGHLNRQSLAGIAVGQKVHAGQKIGALGGSSQNGNWPPHLHFQLMLDMEGKQGDYPGVCRPTEKQQYLNNIPDPGMLLNFPETAFV